MKALIWQWGRRGAGPLVAAAVAHELAQQPGVDTLVSLSTAAELLRLPGAPPNDLPIRTYQDRLGFIARIPAALWLVPTLARAIRASGVDVALCAMPAPFDFVMTAALRRAGIPYAVMVHDAELHPGDTFPLQMRLQRSMLHRAGLLFALSAHVDGQLRTQGFGGAQPLLRATLPPFVFGPLPPPAGSHGGPFRLLSFGRLLPYKGLDLLADAMQRLAGRADIALRVVGSGPESPELDRLRRIPNVAVENRWVPEAELGDLLAWADGLVLTHREASQSGVAAAALAARRWIVATRVGGLEEQLADEPMALLCAPDATSIATSLARLPGLPPPAAARPTDWRRSAEAVTQGLRLLANEAAAGQPATTPLVRDHGA